jgi:hypothetical protein
MSIASVLNAKARPISVWVCDAVVLVYALWTVICHAVMLAGGNVHHLLAAVVGAGAAVVLGAGAFFWRKRRGGAGAAPQVASAEVAVPPPDEPKLDLRSTIVLALLASVVIGSWLVFARPLLFWSAAVIYLVVAAALSLRSEPERGGPAQANRWQEASLWALGLVCAFLALWAHRWRNDDCYYVNLAVTLVDRPDAALLSINTIHAPVAAVPHANAVFPPYRVHSFEALGGFIAYLTGIQAISVIHLGLGTFFSLLLPLALSRLFRLLDAQRWFFMVLAVLALHVLDGTSGLGFANQGIVRMFTGKSVLLSVALPLLVGYGIAFGLRPTLRGFAMLVAAQIMAVGLSSTALWLAPVAAMLAVAVPLRLRPEALRTILLGLLSCGYVLAIALWVRAQLGDAATAMEDEGSTAAAAAGEAGKSLFKPRVGLIYYWLKLIFETPRVIQAYLALLLLAIPAARTALARRYLAAFTLVLCLLFLDPFLGELLRFKVLGRFTGQRGIWLAPLPGALAIAFTALIPTARGRLRRVLGVTAFAGALAAFFALVPTRAVFTRANDVVLRWPPGPKVPVYAFTLARTLSQTLPPGAEVLAPEVVSWYLPTLHHHAFPLLANAKYFRAGADEETRRKHLVDWVSDRDPKWNAKTEERFSRYLRRYALGAVVVSHSASKTSGLGDALKQAGYRRGKAGVPGYQLWLPKQPPRASARGS